ncbi:MAG TPA: restriction endonuclease [Sulfurospirillum sp. UBA12182]|nr:MAG TPA: restriction endonuclease [Sulfurospirillum sp. UBA12182]
MINTIEAYLETIDLDIRKTNSARFFDQKVQPDVLSAVCECILNCINEDDSFSVNDVRYCKYSNELVTEIFNKPDIKKAENEYDKFFSQPLKMLAYSGLLSEEKNGRSNVYRVLKKEFIEYISLRDRNAFYFLAAYLEKVLKDSDLWNEFENFFKVQDNHSLYEIKEKFKIFIQTNTPIKKEYEPPRIFNPLLKILAFKYKKLGTQKGNVGEVNYNDLLYNQLNWRDLKKEKSISRQEFNKVFEHQIDNKKFYKYQIEKAKKFVKSIHKNSEIHRFNSYPATQAHHIFLSSQFPELADIPENIIAITPNQHFYRAHPNNKTAVIDKSYQAICLISKLDSVEIDYRNGNGNYSKEKFIDVINIGFDKKFDYTLDFEELKHCIIKECI